MFSLQNLENKRMEQVLPCIWGDQGGRRREEVTQTIYTHVSKCKNGKIKE
jgi:hypothetical protein